MTTTMKPRAAAQVGTRPNPLPQYSLAQILGVWAGAALPMAALAWLAAPWLASVIQGPAAWPQAILLTLTAGLIWQFALVLILVHREQGTLRWSVLKDALWLREPQSPKTGRKGGLLWLWAIPLSLLVYAREELPKLPAPAGRDLGDFLHSAVGQEFFSGNWTWFALALVMFLFNTVLGEELFFRGLLLPRMRGVFGRLDWLANGVLFALYHLHVPWAIPGRLVNTFILSWPSRRYQSALLGIIAHSSQSVVLAVLLLLLVLR
ncbi:type II CAAX endopeptidase family protein [Microbacterium deminutum]|uniref:CAAX prenyl protease 2/Lysostaphin resistance protein A-like domain-containing protein n=1 Tax=Microbacterium deminutum TaxID=344164 RepID=A0ABP5CDL9_9MICO